MIERMYKVTCDHCGKTQNMDGDEYLSVEYVAVRLYGWQIDDSTGEYYCSQKCADEAREIREYTGYLSH